MTLFLCYNLYELMSWSCGQRKFIFLHSLVIYMQWVLSIFPLIYDLDWLLTWKTPLTLAVLVCQERGQDCWICGGQMTPWWIGLHFCTLYLSINLENLRIGCFLFHCTRAMGVKPVWSTLWCENKQIMNSINSGAKMVKLCGSQWCFGDY